MWPAGVSFIGVTWSKVHNPSLSDVKIHLHVNRQNFEKSIHNLFEKIFFNLNDVSC